MKKFIPFLIILFFVNNSFSQTIDADTLLAKEYISKAENFKQKSDFDNSLIYIEKAENIYSKYNLKKSLSECKLKTADIYIIKGNLNKALQILSVGKQKAMNIFGINSALYADYCDKTGFAYFYAKKYSDAKDMWIKTLVTRRKIYGNNHLKVSDAYNNLGGLYAKTGEYYKSLKLYQNALKIRQKILPENDLKTAYSFINVGNAYLKIDNPDLAAENYLKALKIKNQRLNKYNPELATLYNNLGIVYQTLKEYDKSYKYFNNALLIRQHNLGENHPETAGIYAEIAVILTLKGNYNKATEYNNKALTIFKEKYGEENPANIKILQNIGTVYLKKNDVKTAVEYFNKSLEITKKRYEIWSLATAKEYTKVGKIFNKGAKNDAALNYFENALKILRNVYQTDNHIEIAEALQNIGIVYQDNKDYYQAMEYYNKSLALRIKLSGNKHTETAHICYLLASAYKAKRNYAAELKYLQKALISNIENFNNQDINANPDFSENVFYFDQNLLIKTVCEKADALNNLYLRTNNIENLKNACKVYETSDLLFDRIKNTISGKRETAFLYENMTYTYERAIRANMLLFKKTSENQYLNKAFVYSEKIKSDEFLYTLSSFKNKKLAGITDSVLNIEINLLADIAWFRKKIKEKPEDFKTKLLKAENKFNSFVLMLKDEYEKYYDLKYEPCKVTIKNIQNLINAGTLVLDYYFAGQSDFIYIFMIKKDNSDLRVFKKTNDFDDKISDFKKYLSSNSGNNTAYTNAGYELYKKLVPEVAAEDTSIKQLLIIPDRNSGIIPFEALLTEKYYGNPSMFEDYPFLIKKYAVSYSVSGDLFYKTFYDNIVDTFETDSSDYWLGVAPIFDGETGKITSLKTKNNLQNAGVNFLNGNYISPLTGSENELITIFNEFNDNKKEAVLKTRSEADETFFKSDEIEDYKFLHIASYAFVNKENPELSGILTAQNPVNGNDGVLFISELSGLELYCDLLVLPYCETGFGKNENEKAMNVFNRALLSAETDNIILSLWQASGESGEKLMIDFYSDILNKSEETDNFIHPLQSVKLKLIKDGRYAHPFYWSPFILIGK
ncbi:MAG: CHAT domain-containing protein [Chlorobi bacterium]|nr:CHAT domain-containing protein [Chlorobiota bacterium]